MTACSLKKGTSVPNRYGAAPTAFSFARWWHCVTSCAREISG